MRICSPRLAQYLLRQQRVQQLAAPVAVGQEEEEEEANEARGDDDDCDEPRGVAGPPAARFLDVERPGLIAREVGLDRGVYRVTQGGCCLLLKSITGT